MQVLIIGAGGFVGKHLSSYLQVRGFTVCCSSSRDKTGIDPHTGILPSKFSVPKGTQAIVYLAQSPHYSEGLEYAEHIMEVNLLSAVRAAKAGIRSGVERFVYASTGTVYEPRFYPIPENSKLCRQSWYALSKIQAEEALQLLKDDIEICVPRLFAIYGPGQSGRLVRGLVDRIRMQKPVTIEPHPYDPEDRGGLRISLCQVHDLCMIFEGLITSGAPSPINIASHEVLSIREMAVEIGRQIGIEPRFVKSDKPRVGNLVADITLLQHSLGPSFTPFQSGLAQLLEAVERIKR